MFKATEEQGTLSKTLVNDYLLTWLEAFMVDRKAQGHQCALKLKTKPCGTSLGTTRQEVGPGTLVKSGHNEPGRARPYCISSIKSLIKSLLIKEGLDVDFHSNRVEQIKKNLKILPDKIFRSEQIKGLVGQSCIVHPVKRLRSSL